MADVAAPAADVHASYVGTLAATDDEGSDAPMGVDYGRLEVQDVIVHSIVRPPGSSTAAATYSEATLEWEDVDRGFLQQKFRAALASSRPVVEDDDEDCPTPAIVRALLTGGGDLVADSKVVADLVVAKQSWNSPDGLLMLALARVKGDTCVVVAKLEHEQGMQMEQTENDAGLRTYRAHFLRNLILGQGTKVFKVGAFPAAQARGKLLRGDAVDEQNRGVADYFRRGVLGCDFVERSDVLTERFFKAAQRWVNRQPDDEDKARYEMALLAEMQSAKTTVSAEQFAREHVDARVADDFVAAMTSASVPPRSFTKDTTQINGEIRRVKVQTRRGASVYVPPAMYDDGSFEIAKGDEDEVPTLSIRDDVTSMTGASGKKPGAESAE